MFVFIINDFLQVNFFQFINVIYALLILLLLLIIFISAYTIYKRRIEFYKKVWLHNIQPLISDSIFAQEEDEQVKINLKMQMLFKKSIFRQYVIDEIIHIKKNLTGSSTINIKKLYERLTLNADSFKKLSSFKWHIRAKGIQELAMMEQVVYEKEIFSLTSNPNELVRNEAQCAMISFYGFSGLRFLAEIKYPMSQWQQIQLLNKLNEIRPDNFDAVKDWLLSENESVVIFSLKLATYYNCYGLYNNIINCLQNAGSVVKLVALDYLIKMPQADTADLILNHYPSENKVYKLTVIHALKNIGNESHIPFLLKKLHDKNDDIKAAAAKSLSYLHPSGAAFLQAHLFADENPWKAIFLQITNDRAA
jgi:hypothetical protein